MVRYIQIKGGRFRELRTGRFISQKTVMVRVRRKLGVQRYWNTVHRIKKAHPNWSYKNIRRNMKNSKLMGRNYNVDWFGKYSKAPRDGYKKVSDYGYYRRR